MDILALKNKRIRLAQEKESLWANHVRDLTPDSWNEYDEAWQILTDFDATLFNHPGLTQKDRKEIGL